MKRISIGRALLSMLLVPLLASAGSYLVPDDRSMIERADGIAVGVVLSSHSFMAPGGLILTDHLVGVEEGLKGAVAAGATATIREVGGTVGDESLVSSTAPGFAPGERVLVFLSRLAPDRWTTWSGELGKFSFVRDLDSAVLVREATAEEIFGWELPSARRYERVREAEEFLGYVRRVVASGTSQPASAAGAVAQEGPVEADSASVASTAAGIWNGDSGSSINVSISGTAASNTYGSVNGSNTLNFDVPESFTYGGGTQPLAGTVVGQALLRASSAQHQSSLGESYYTSTECDIVIQASLGFIETEVTAHEMGHCLGFRHSNVGTPSSSVALMNSSVGNGASLKAWDRDAANQVYGDGTYDATSTSGNAFLMQFSFTPAAGGRWQSGGFSMNVFETPVCSLPVITSQPASPSIASGQTATLTVTATGATSYQWYRGTSGSELNLISGATTSSYTTEALTATSQYWVKVTNACGSVNSTTATVTISCPKPGITVQPQSSSISSGESKLLSVVASNGPLTYQWYRGNAGDTSQPIAGATNSTYTTGALTSTTSFWVKVTNSCGSTNSVTATLTVCVIPTITAQPQNATITSGQAATLTVVASGATMYQWYRGIKGSTTNPINGATTSSYNTGPLTATSQYWVRAASNCAAADSDTVTVTVQSSCVAPAITAQPQSATVDFGETATLTVAATGTNLQYQWYQGPKGDLGRPIAGATTSAYTTPALTAAAQYWVFISNECGNASSETATLTVGCSIAITQEPQSVKIQKGETASFSVAATGPAPLTYQWYVGASGDESDPIAGATGTTLGTGAISKTTKFWVKVTSPCGTVDSQTATASVPGRKRIVRR